MTERRTNTDWARFLRDTQRPGALNEAFEPEEAKALRDRFEFVHTPKHGSWLNVAEVELNVHL